MTNKIEIEIEIERRSAPFTLDLDGQRWQSMDEQKEGNFPLVAVVDGKRYELYSDGTFAEVER